MNTTRGWSTGNANVTWLFACTSPRPPWPSDKFSIESNSNINWGGAFGRETMSSNNRWMIISTIATRVSLQNGSEVMLPFGAVARTGQPNWHQKNRSFSGDVSDDVHVFPDSNDQRSEDQDSSYKEGYNIYRLILSRDFSFCCWVMFGWISDAKKQRRMSKKSNEVFYQNWIPCIHS